MSANSILEHPALRDRDSVRSQLNQIDFDLLARLFRKEPQAQTTHSLHPICALKSYDPTASDVGVHHIQSGKVAAFTVAGGQGTRLGFDGPKGTFIATKLLKLSLFEIFAQKIRAAQERYETNIPWVVMTSPINNEETEEFFEQHNFFGLDRDSVRFFTQGTMPAVDASSGELLLASPNSLALSPDGHGGSIKALKRSGTLDWLKRQGVSTLSYFQVDNPLVRPIDPAFIGQHLLGASEFSSKSVAKSSWDEKVGVFAKRGQSVGIVEYSDMTRQQAQLLDKNGNLAFVEGNIAIHLLSIEFIERIAQNDGLPYHCASKKVPYLDNSGKLIEPQQPNAIKFEQFIFDALAVAKNPLVVRVNRSEEFSAIKNAEGKDSPDSAWADMCKLWCGWLVAAGVSPEEIPSSLEIAPLYADTAQSFIKRFKQNPTRIREGIILK